MKLYYYLVCVFLFVTSFKTFAQDSRVLITEEKKRKRVNLYAENTTKDSLNIFLLVFPEGFRRSASQPKLTDIAPKQKILMTTLIELGDNSTNTYTYELIITDRRDDINLSFKKNTIDIEKTITDKVVVFSREGCEKCDYLNKVLVEKRIAHRNFDVKKDAKLYKQFLAFMSKKYPNKEIVQMPVVWNKTYLIFGYDEVEDVLLELEK